MSVRNAAPSLLIGLALSGCVPVAPSSDAAPTDNAAPTELTGRTPGQSQSCIPTQRTEALRYAGERTIVYGRGRTVWVNRLGAGCAGIHPADTLIVRAVGGRYCRGDLLQSTSATSRAQGPGCYLSDFVPYVR